MRIIFKVDYTVFEKCDKLSQYIKHLIIFVSLS